MKENNQTVFVDDRDVNRRIIYLMSKLSAPKSSILTDEDLLSFINTAYFFSKLVNKNKQYLKKTKAQNYLTELYDILIRENLLNKETLEKWTLITFNVKRLKSKYKEKPKRSKKDNNGVYVGSGDGDSKSVRAPKLKRKTAWKRFLALFPDYKGKKPKKLK